MALREQIVEDMKNAMKAGETERLSVLRMLKARIMEAEVEQRSKKGLDYRLADPEVVDVLKSYAKQRRQSIESYQQAGREDLARKEESELAIVQQYLPRQLSQEQIEQIVSETIAETGATGPQEMGAVMKAVMAKVHGAADGKVVSDAVRKQLSK